MRVRQVRIWDAEMCTCTERHDGSKAVYSVAAAPAGSQLVAYGGAERALHVWDPRTPTGKETVRQFRVHHGILTICVHVKVAGGPPTCCCRPVVRAFVLLTCLIVFESEMCSKGGASGIW